MHTYAMKKYTLYACNHLFSEQRCNTKNAYATKCYYEYRYLFENMILFLIDQRIPECDCDRTGTSECNHETGECVCFPGVEGRRCDVCARDTWGIENGIAVR